MWKNINKTWASNHGWLLSGASFLVALFACLIWYLDLVPQIMFSGPTTKQPLLSQAIQPQSGVLVAQVSAPAESHGQKGRIQLYSPSIDQMQPPMYHEKFVIDERGMAAILLIVPASDYTVVAFIDANDNGQLDFDGERAIEAFRLPRTVAVSGETDSSTPVEGGLIRLQPQVPLLCTFDFLAESH